MRETTLSPGPRPRGEALTTGPGVSFLTQPEEARIHMDALYRGPLVVREGCVLIGSPGDYSVPIWPKGFAAVRDEAGRIIVRDGEGAVVAAEGEKFEMGGGYAVEFRSGENDPAPHVRLRSLEEQLGYAIPNRCLGPNVYGIWIVGEA